MNIVVNGHWEEVPGELSISELLERWELRDRPCAVEVNRKLVPRTEHSSVTLHDGDEIEIVTLVGGG